MNMKNSSLAALLISAMAITGAAGVANARMGGHGGPHQGAYAGAQISPEMQQSMEKAYNTIAPLQLELRAKQAELTAKIYSGADDKTIQDLSKEVNALQAKVTDARVKMQKDFAKAGIPMNHAFGCMNGGPEFGMNKGQGMMHGGFHRGMGMGHGPAMPPSSGSVQN